MFAVPSARRFLLMMTGAAIVGTVVGTTVTLAGAQTHPAAAAAGQHDVRFGAQGGRHNIRKPAINEAIDAAAAAGGGTGRFTAGNYLCYSIHLKSNIILFRDPGAIIVSAETRRPRGTTATIRPNPTPGTNTRISATATKLYF